MKYFIFCLFLIFVSTIGCTDDNVVMICGSLDTDFVSLRADLNQRLIGLKPNPSGDDRIGHKKNLDLFVEQLKTECGLDASVRCYACIYTLPAQSEVKILIHSSNGQIQRILDIRTPVDGVMKVVNIHN